LVHHTSKNSDKNLYFLPCDRPDAGYLPVTNPPQTTPNPAPTATPALVILAGVDRPRVALAGPIGPDPLQTLFFARIRNRPLARGLQPVTHRAHAARGITLTRSPRTRPNTILQLQTTADQTQIAD